MTTRSIDSTERNSDEIVKRVMFDALEFTTNTYYITHVRVGCFRSINLFVRVVAVLLFMCVLTKLMVMLTKSAMTIDKSQALVRQMNWPFH